jgi:hypothetical protein
VRITAMPNGKPHDHPLTDIFVHKLAVYGSEADDLIRKIGALSSERELGEWWENEIGWNPDPKVVLKRAQIRYGELMTRAKDSGWETEK